MNKRIQGLVFLGISLSAVGCGKLDQKSKYNLADVPQFDFSVVRSRAVFQIQTGDPTYVSWTKKIFHFFLHPYSTAVASNVSGSISVKVVNAALSSMTLDSTQFTIPPISNGVIAFNYLQITSLLDNQLKVCGVNNKQKCGTAMIRMYTTGTAKAGLYNSEDDYGAPIVAGQTVLGNVGLNVANALVLQSISIPNSKNVVHLTDFANPKYFVQSDFTNAGAGSYSTTLVVEYALAP